MKDIDIVIPVYNAEANIPDLLVSLENWSANVSANVHFIFVDDASGDNSYQCLVDKLQEVRNFSFEVIQLAKNYGQHTATAVGFSFSSSSLVGTMDDDLQHNPEDFDVLIAKMDLEDLDLVYGTYDDKAHAAGRNLGSRMLKRLMGYSDIDYSIVTSFRLMKSEVVEGFKMSLSPVIFLDEFLLRNASAVESCKVSHAKRVNGESNYSTWKLIRFAIQILMLHSPLPLKIITRFGLLMSIIFFIIGCYYIYAKFAFGSELGFTSLIVSIFFSTGMILLSLGIIGEYIRRLWVAQKNFDRVLIRKKC